MIAKPKNIFESHILVLTQIDGKNQFLGIAVHYNYVLQNHFDATELYRWPSPSVFSGIGLPWKKLTKMIVTLRSFMKYSKVSVITGY